MASTKIEWADAVINPVVGCSKCSPGCDNCYAERFAARMAKHPNPKIAGKYAGVVDERGKWTGKISALDLSCFDKLPKKPQRIFVGSMTDMFHPGVNDVGGPGLRAMLDIFREHPQHTFITLTKRPDRMERDIEWFIAQDGDLPDNYWPGVTIWDQPSADEFIPILLRIPAAKRIVSIEPMLGPVNLGTYLNASYFQCRDCGHREMDCNCMCPGCSYIDKSGVGYCPECDVRFLNNEICVCSKCEGNTVSPSSALDWVICGGETGPNARPMHPDWVRSLRDQCQAAGVPFLFKSWGEWTHSSRVSANLFGVLPTKLIKPDGSHGELERIEHHFYKVGKKRAGRLLDGREWNEVPKCIL